MYVHRLVAEAFLGAASSPTHEVAHWDGDPSNNRVENLRWATPEENTADKVRHGRISKGESRPKSKLTAENVRVIRFHLLNHASQQQIAEMFDIDRKVISAIKNKKAWTHVD